MGVGADQAMIADDAVMPTARPDHRVLQYDAVPSDLDRSAAFPDQPGAMHDAGSDTDDDIAADARIRRDPGR